MAKDTMQEAGDWIILQLPELGPELAMSDHQQIQMNLPEVAVFITLELSKSAWLLAAQAVPSEKTSAHRLSGGYVEGLLALLRRLQAREQGSSGREAAIILGYEAGYDGFWLQRRLSAEAITCFVMDPGSLQVERRARRAKTDRLDAAMLLRALMAWCRGDHAACRMVQVPSVEREDARRTHRERQRLIAERVQHVNRIKGLLATQGVYTFRPLRRDRWEQLKAVRTGDGRDLPQRLRGEIEREFRRLELVLEQIAAAEAERDAAVRNPADEDADAEKVVRLARLGGIGTELATVLVREALYRPFANRKQGAAYAGLTPNPYASGDRQRDQGISKAGNPLLRKAMVELAWLWLRYQPGSGLARWFVERVGTGRGRIRKITAVAMARKLLVALWRYLATGLVPEGAHVKAA